MNTCRCIVVLIPYSHSLVQVVSRAFQAFKQEVETAKTFVSENKQAALCTELPDRLQELKLHREDIVALRVIGSGVYGKVGIKPF